MIRAEARPLEGARGDAAEEVVVPANLAGPAQVLHRVYVVVDGELCSTGLCQARSDALARARAMVSGDPVPPTPRGQVGEGEMACARRWAADAYPGPGGSAIRQAVEAAVAAGPDTIEWALASRLVFAGIAPYRRLAGGGWVFAGGGGAA